MSPKELSWVKTLICCFYELMILFKVFIVLSFYISISFIYSCKDWFCFWTFMTMFWACLSCSIALTFLNCSLFFSRLSLPNFSISYCIWVFWFFSFMVWSSAIYCAYFISFFAISTVVFSFFNLVSNSFYYSSICERYF